MNNTKQQMTEAMHILSKDIAAWNKRIAQLNYPRWVLASTDGRMLRLSVGDFDAFTSMCNLDQLIEFQTEQEAFDALEAMRSSQHLNAVSELVRINLLLPRFIPINQYEINNLQSWINESIEKIKFFQYMLDIPNEEGTQQIDLPEKQVDVELEYNILTDEGRLVNNSWFSDKEAAVSWAYCWLRDDGLDYYRDKWSYVVRTKNTNSVVENTSC